MSQTADGHFSFKNITVSGLPGSGSTTMLNQLREHPELKFHRWTGFSGGEFMRSYAAEKGLLDQHGKLHHTAEAYGEDFDREVDYGMRERLSKEKYWILESWLSGFMAQGVPGTFKILMICSNMAVKVDRVVNRDHVTPDLALEHMNHRYKTNVAKWRRMYKQEWHDWVVNTGKADESDPIDFWQPNLYDIVIDTYSTNQTESLELVLHAITSQSPHQ